MKKIVFFDIDDTLVDYTGAQDKVLIILRKKFFPHASQEKFNQVWIEKTKENWKLFVERKITFQEQRIRRIRSIWISFGKKVSMREVDKIISLYVNLFESNWKLLAGVKHSLQVLKKKGIKLGIISNGNYEQQNKKLKQVGLYDIFEEKLILISEEVGFSKPDLRIFQRAQQISGFDSSEIVFFGDEVIKDFEPGQKMKWETILVDSPGKIRKWVLENV